MLKPRRIKLEPALSREEIARAYRRYRFDLGEGCSPERFGAVYGELTGSLAAEACWSADFDKKTLGAAVTLGSGFDEREEKWSQGGELLQAYMAECIGMELLDQARRELEARICRETGLSVAQRRFPGEGTPLEEVERILRELSASFITCNGAFVLTPKKSVVYIGRLTEGKEDGSGSRCAGCGNEDCPYRQES